MLKLLLYATISLAAAAPQLVKTASPFRTVGLDVEDDTRPAPPPPVAECNTRFKASDSCLPQLHAIADSLLAWLIDADVPHATDLWHEKSNTYEACKQAGHNLAPCCQNPPVQAGEEADEQRAAARTCLQVRARFLATEDSIQNRYLAVDDEVRSAFERAIAN